MTAIRSTQFRPGERRDQIVGTLMILAGIGLIALNLVPSVVIPSQLFSLRHMGIPVALCFLSGGYELRNSHAANLGEAPQFRTPKARRISGAILGATGLVGTGLSLIFQF